MNNFKFPCWKLPKYKSIETMLDRTYITTYYGEYVLDDKAYEGDLALRRLRYKLSPYSKRVPIYPLKKQVNLLRQLVKYPTGTKFIDVDGNIISYKKGHKLYDVVSKNIRSFNYQGNYTIFYVEGSYQPYITQIPIEGVKCASFMTTEFGTFLYDFTEDKHSTYKRKL